MRKKKRNSIERWHYRDLDKELAGKMERIEYRIRTLRIHATDS